MEILQVKNLSFAYPDNDRNVLEDVTFDVQAGDFVVVFGETGCGKTTLLRMLKRELTPVGSRSGSVAYNGIQLDALDARTSACDIGFVMQKPENQIVTDKVWHELAFGLENMGLPTSVIRRRVSEMASYFGIGGWFRRDVSELSGGQKQLLNLASVMVMQPKVLILDEPTSQLDPIAAAEFITVLQKLNRELSLTIVLVEHRLEEIFPIADKALMLRQGRIVQYDSPRAVAQTLAKEDPMTNALPGAVRLYHTLQAGGECPLTVKEGRRYIEEHFDQSIRRLEQPPYTHSPEAALEFRDVWFRYDRESPDVLRGTSFTVYQQEIFCILGGNASGKTTALRVAAGLRRPYSGKIRVLDKPMSAYKGNSLYRQTLALLPQDAQTVFLKDTVREDLEELGGGQANDLIDLTPFLDKHPYDLSGGQQQLCALAKTLLLGPRLLLLDEPTKGIDAHAKRNIVRILRGLKEQGKTIVIVTHDVEFAALCADRCALFFDGEITSCDVPSLFFSENNFYTTSANRMTRSFYDNIVTVEDAVNICKQNGGTDR